jgi:hypothetical protein
MPNNPTPPALFKPAGPPLFGANRGKLQESGNPAFASKPEPGAPKVYRPQIAIAALRSSPAATAARLYAPTRSLQATSLQRSGVREAPAVYRPGQPAPGAAPPRYIPTPVARTAQTAPAAYRPLVLSSAAQRMRHRPEIRSTIEHAGKTWTVENSTKENSQIRIKSKEGQTTTRNLQWETVEDYWNMTPGDPSKGDNDYDMRNRAGWQADDVNYNAGEVWDYFLRAKAKALDLIKAKLREFIKKPSYTVAINAIGLPSFNVTKNDVNPQFPVPVGQTAACEWSLTWLEGSTRTWTLVIDADRPLPNSNQEAHVGYTISATATKKGLAVSNIFGHVWVNAVPVSRQG